MTSRADSLFTESPPKKPDTSFARSPSKALPKRVSHSLSLMTHVLSVTQIQTSRSTIPSSSTSKPVLSPNTYYPLPKSRHQGPRYRHPRHRNRCYHRTRTIRYPNPDIKVHDTVIL